MPPKRKAPAAPTAKTGPKPKLAKSDSIIKALESLSKKEDNIKTVYSIDQNCPHANTSGAKIHQNYDAMLNQTNIGKNNNKFYVMQVIDVSGSYYAWNRWGRVGEKGQSAMKGPLKKVDEAIKDFEKKFQDKTKNKWSDHENFQSVPGKYTLMLLSNTPEETNQCSSSGANTSESQANQKVLPSKLDSESRRLVMKIFDKDMFNEAMSNLEIDTKKMPLGSISNNQIFKAFEVLVELMELVEGNKKKSSSSSSTVESLTSRFYTLIPHDFGRRRPTLLGTKELVRKKMDMLLILGDIALAQDLQKDDKKQTANDTKQETKPDPVDCNYDLLNCELTLLKATDNEYKVIEEFWCNTLPGNKKLFNVWKVERKGEEARFQDFANLPNHKLLWHGTNVAVVVAILKSGLRIMPHSGGRVGKGIYFASLCQKSYSYTWSSDQRAIMFLNEVALGTENHIFVDNQSLTKPPQGYDSVVAQGSMEFDPSGAKNLTIDGRQVLVPCGRPKIRNIESAFHESEYLIYNEAQCRIRYLCEVQK